MAFSLMSQGVAGEPMGNKSVKEFAGISEALANKLSKKGYKKAYNVLGQFLLLNKNEKLFKDWLTNSIQASSEQSEKCYNCLKTQCDNCL